jgi:hypothetical protein
MKFSGPDLGLRWDYALKSATALSDTSLRPELEAGFLL